MCLYKSAWYLFGFLTLANLFGAKFADKRTKWLTFAFLPPGYGQTEATAAISISLPGDFNSGSVGTPALCCEVKLADVPEQEYYAKNGKGEVCARGMNIFMGYYKDEEKTAEALDSDSWLHTGDIGMWLPVSSFVRFEC